MAKKKVITEEWITRQEACELLGGVSERAVQRYAAKKMIRVDHRKRMGGGTEAFYSKLDVLALKHRLQTPPTALVQPALVAASSALAPTMAKVKEEKKKNLKIRISEKLILNVAEAAAISGLSQERIKQAINIGELKGSLPGHWVRGYGIKRVDLEEYVKALSPNSK